MATAVVAPLDFIPLRSFPSVPSLALSGSFRPSLHGRYPASPLLWLLLTSPRLSPERSPQVRCRIYPPGPSGSTACVSYDYRVSLFPASSPPACGLAASSCSYGRKFAPRCFRLRLAATSCASLRLPSSVPVGSFHPTRFCPCWAHWGRPPGLQPTPSSACSHSRKSRTRGSGADVGVCTTKQTVPGITVYCLPFHPPGKNTTLRGR